MIINPSHHCKSRFTIERIYHVTKIRAWKKNSKAKLVLTGQQMG